MNSVVIFDSIKDLHRKCLTLPDEYQQEELLFRILINPSNKLLYKKYNDVFDFPPTTDICVNDNYPNWAKKAKRRADRWLSISSNTTLCRILLVNKKGLKGTCLTFSIKNNSDSFDINYARDFLETYKIAWHESAKFITNNPISIKNLYNSFEVIGFPESLNTSSLRFKGSSAFLSFFIPLVMMGNKIPLSPLIAFAGAYSEQTGLVEPVDKAKLKVRTAQEYGMQLIFIHEDNFKDIAEKQYPAVKIIPYHTNKPTKVAEEILAKLSELANDYPGTMQSEHQMNLFLKDQLEPIGRALSECESDIHSGDRKKADSTLTKLVDCKKWLQNNNLNDSNEYLKTLMLLFKFYSNRANDEETSIINTELTKILNSKHEIIDHENQTASSFLDTFQVEKSNHILQQAIMKCNEISRNSELNGTIERVDKQRNELRRTLAQNRAYSGDSLEALQLLESIGKLDSQSYDNRYYNYLTHAICDLNDVNEWEKLKNERPILKLPEIINTYIGIYDVHTHIKGYLVFGSIEQCRTFLNSLPIQREPLFRKLHTTTPQDPYAGLVFRCIGLLYEKMYQSSNDQKDYQKALEFYNHAKNNFLDNSVFSSVQHSNTIAHIASLTHDLDLAYEALELLQKTIKKFNPNVNEVIWKKLTSISTANKTNSLESCNQLKILLKRFQWW